MPSQKKQKASYAEGADLAGAFEFRLALGDFPSSQMEVVFA